MGDEGGLGALARLLEDSSNWHGLDKVVTTAPKAFIERAWPILIEILEPLGSEAPRFTNQYRFHKGGWLERDRPGHEHPLPEAFETGVPFVPMMVRHRALLKLL
jgi:hypothetical protein